MYRFYRLFNLSLIFICKTGIRINYVLLLLLLTIEYLYKSDMFLSRVYISFSFAVLIAKLFSIFDFRLRIKILFQFYVSDLHFRVNPLFVLVGLQTGCD